jgi:hypothetical protein
MWCGRSGARRRLRRCALPPLSAPRRWHGGAGAADRPGPPRATAEASRRVREAKKRRRRACVSCGSRSRRRHRGIAELLACIDAIGLPEAV